MTEKTITEAEYVHAFEGIENFRDVGVTINEFLRKRVIREGLLFRSGRLDGATAEDKQTFKESYGIKTVLDLRTDTERIVQFSRNASAYDEGKSPETVEPIVGLETHRIHIVSRSLETAMLQMLSWWSIFKVIFFMLFGYRISVVKIFSNEVIEKVGMVGMGTMALEYSGNEIKKMFEILISESNPPFPIIAHCTQGKDRTGLVILLILLCLHTPPPSPAKSSFSEQIPLEAMSHDYTLTQAGLQRIREKMMEEIVNDIGLPPSFINVDPGFVNTVADFLRLKYGGIRGYLASLGLDGDYIVCKLQERLLVSP